MGIDSESFQNLSTDQKLLVLNKSGEFGGSREYYGQTQCLYLIDESFYVVVSVIESEPPEVVSVEVIPEEKEAEHLIGFKPSLKDLNVILHEPRRDNEGGLIV